MLNDFCAFIPSDKESSSIPTKTSASAVALPTQMRIVSRAENGAEVSSGRAGEA